MIINKTTYWFKHLDTEPNKPTNQKLIRVATYTRKLLVLGSVIYSPKSAPPPCLKQIISQPKKVAHPPPSSMLPTSLKNQKWFLAFAMSSNPGWL